MKFTIALACIVGMTSAVTITQKTADPTGPLPEQPNQYNRICDKTVASNVDCKAQMNCQVKRVCDDVHKQEGCFESLGYEYNNTPNTLSK